jgi:O-antigen/teichoic acid export membrane protein
MSLRLDRRQGATAAGLWGSAAIGIASTVAAFRILGIHDFGLFATALAAAGFFQTLLDLTAEEALTKYGFRYLEAGEPGRVRRLFRFAMAAKVGGGAAAAVLLAALAPLGNSVFDVGGLTAPLLVASLIPLVQAPENVAATAFLLHGRYDLRGLYQSFAMTLRLGGIVAGSFYGVFWAIAGLVVAQGLATAAVWAAGAVALRRLPAGHPIPIGEDRREIGSFVVRSSVATGVVSLRGSLVPLLLGMVSTTTQVGLLRVALAPVTGLTTLSSPVRLIMLTEQTRDWERGRRLHVIRGVRRYSGVALLLSLVFVPILYVAMPDLVRLVFGAESAAAIDAARIALFAAALGLVFGWTKSFPVSIGRPGLRVAAHLLETAVLLPLVIVLGRRSGVEGAAWALLISTAVFAATWIAFFARIQAAVTSQLPLARPESARR